MGVFDRSHASGGSELRQAGEAFGRYEILFPIASGGMATVYAARVMGEGSFQKPVAIKLMLPHLTRDERFATMFMDEATLAAHIESPNVVGVRDLGREGDTLYMAMDLVIGPTLRELLCVDRLPAPMTASVIVQTARGLHDAHRARSVTGDPLHLVHRDVSPHNILVGFDGRVRLSDFGVARAIHRRSHTETGELKGKLAYFSPEQLEACDALDHRSDIFALGVVAWEAFTGERLFAAPNPLALAKLIATLPIPRLDERVGLPTPIADVVAKALEREAERRFQTAEEMADELERAARASIGWASPSELGEAVRARGGARVHDLERRIHRLMGEASAAFEPHVPVAATTLEQNVTSTHRAHSVARTVAVAVAILVAVGGGIFLGLRPADPAPENALSASSEVVDTVEPIEPAAELAAAAPVHLAAEPDDMGESVEQLEERPPRGRRRARGMPRSTAAPRDQPRMEETSAPYEPPPTGSTRMTASERTTMSILRVDSARFERLLRSEE